MARTDEIQTVYSWELDTVPVKSDATLQLLYLAVGPQARYGKNYPVGKGRVTLTD